LPPVEPQTECAVIPRQIPTTFRPQQAVLGVHAEAIPVYAVHAACAWDPL
jgi:hypothetical protein